MSAARQIGLPSDNCRKTWVHTSLKTYISWYWRSNLSLERKSISKFKALGFEYEMWIKIHVFLHLKMREILKKKKFILILLNNFA